MIKLIKNTFYNEEKTKKELIKFISSRKQLSFGPECLKFEKNFAKYQGRKHCIFFNSGSSANLALIQALVNIGLLKKADKVGFSALTWSTNIMPLIQLGLKPIPIDIEVNTLNISSKKINEKKKKEDIKAIFLTNALGFCDDIDKIKEICDKDNIILLEDNCEALGTVYKNKKLGNFGLASTFSFFVGHHMSTIEGGAVCTDDKNIANALRIVRAHGWDRHLDEKEQNSMRKNHKVTPFYAKYTFYDLGYNLRPTEINGFLGNKELKSINKITRIRSQNFKMLAKNIYNSDKYLPIDFGHIDFISNFAMPVICRTKDIHNEILKKCEGKIEVRPIIGGDITRQPFFLKYIPSSLENKNAKLVHEQGLYFPNNPHLTKEEIKKIISILR